MTNAAKYSHSPEKVRNTCTTSNAQTSEVIRAVAEKRGAGFRYGA